MRTKSDSFVAEFPLKTTAADEHEASIRLEAARHIYNACLGEALRRLTLLRESRDGQRSGAMPKGKKRTEAFKAARQRFGLSFGAIQKFAERCRDACWIGDHLRSHDTQTTSLRALRAVEQYALGKRGRPRFKGRNRLRSVEGKSNSAVIRFRAKPVPSIHWSGLVLPLVLDPRDRDGWQAQALSRAVKYVRIVRREIKGRTGWYAQLVMEGLPPVKACRPVGSDEIGLDIGPSTIAAVSGRDAMLEQFCPTVEQPWRRLRRVERAMDRSRRATNPENYNADGAVKRGPRKWIRSRRYRALAFKRCECERRLAAERRRAHGEMSNRILAQGSTIKAEAVSYKSFQRNFGRSVKVRAPGMLISILRRKAESAGGRMEEIDPRKTRLSQFDHSTGGYAKKPLSQRVHVFGDGQTEPVQRDLYSAFLARCCDVDSLDVRRVLAAWPGAEPLLRRAMSRFNQPARGQSFALPHGPGSVRAGRPSKSDGRTGEAGDVVATMARTPEDLGNGVFRTPRL